jgi:hypothetical protein
VMEELRAAGFEASETGGLFGGRLLVGTHVSRGTSG